MNANVRILAAGGTFDKHYNPLDGSLGFGQSYIPNILSDARLNQAVAFEVVMQIDSLDMTQAHRQHLLQRVIDSNETALVVIHGTDTMVQTAAVLGAAFNAGTASAKTVVLTGAMVPFAIANSDATFNLGFALAASQVLAPGVYIAMGGQVFHWQEVQKNRLLGKFEAVSKTTSA
jgi:L-asparaginase